MSENATTTAKRGPGRPSQAEVANRVPPQETTVLAIPDAGVSRTMVPMLMVCCGRGETPLKIRDMPEYTLIECPGCGKRSHLYPTRQQVL